jgi:peptidoglycan hydrolase CwlO-like protein
LRQEIVEKNSDIVFYKDRINKSEARYAQLADDYRKLLANQNGQESKTSHLVQMRNELDDKAREIMDLKKKMENQAKKLEDQDRLRKGS